MEKQLPMQAKYRGFSHQKVKSIRGLPTLNYFLTPLETFLSVLVLVILLATWVHSKACSSFQLHLESSHLWGMGMGYHPHYSVVQIAQAQKDLKLWLDYWISPTHLQVQRQERMWSCSSQLSYNHNCLLPPWSSQLVYQRAVIPNLSKIQKSRAGSFLNMRECWKCWSGG
jgi:hypothetical protein